MKGKLVKECEGCRWWHQGVMVHHNHCDSGWRDDKKANGHSSQYEVNRQTGKHWCYEEKME